ncbi:MAG: hypothetical protein AAGM40_30540, partial [Cyanobacteria bacterium J06573_2]
MKQFTITFECSIRWEDVAVLRLYINNDNHLHYIRFHNHIRCYISCNHPVCFSENLRKWKS